VCTTKNAYNVNNVKHTREKEKTLHTERENRLETNLVCDLDILVRQLPQIEYGAGILQHMDRTDKLGGECRQ
jgi:hypothetical protein